MNELLNLPNLRQLIAENDLPTVFAQLNLAASQLANDDFTNQLTLLESREKKLRADQRRGILTSEQYNVEKNRINESLLTLATEMSQATTNTAITASSNTDIKVTVTTNSSASVTDNTTIAQKKVSWKPILAAIVTTIGVLAGLAEITGYSFRDLLERDSSDPVILGDTMKAVPPPIDTVPPSPPPPKSPVTKKTEILPLPPPKAKLQVQIQTQRGRQNLVFKENEEVLLYFKVSRPCQLRTIYRLADNTLVLLDNDRLVNAPETNRWVQLADGFEVAEPFGVEELYIFAQETAFPKLITEEIDGYTIIREGLPSALRKTRGLKKKQVFAEDRLTITTKKRESI
ncbi:MAG: hypothetical protein AAF960_02470 [Bacteroidota bacterium]